MKENKKTAPLWLIIGVVVLIVLLMLWLTFADASGDTDVNANFTSILANHTNFA